MPLFSPFTLLLVYKIFLTSAKLALQLAGRATGGGAVAGGRRVGRWRGGGAGVATTWAGRPGVAVRLATVAGRSRNDGRGSTVVGIL